MGLVSNLLQRTVGRQKLRQWASNNHLENFPDVQVERRYEEDDDYIDLYWFMHASSNASMVSSCYARCYWDELDDIILKMEQGEVPLTVEELLREQLSNASDSQAQASASASADVSSNADVSVTTEDVSVVEDPASAEELLLEEISAENDTINTQNDTIKSEVGTLKHPAKNFSQPENDGSIVLGKPHKIAKACKRQSRLKKMIMVNPYITMPEMAKRLGVSRPTIARDLLDMKNEGILRHVGAVKNGYWELLLPQK